MDATISTSEEAPLVPAISLESYNLRKPKPGQWCTGTSRVGAEALDGGTSLRHCTDGHVQGCLHASGLR